MVDAKFIVYVVDDDESVSDSLKLLMESSGYDVLAFKSAEDFLDSGFATTPCCLVLDIHLPRMNGFELQAHLADSGKQIPVFFITGKHRFQMEEKAMQSGAVAYLRKPFDGQLLLDAIQPFATKTFDARKGGGES